MVDTFRHPHHNQIIAVLSALKKDLFVAGDLLFAGGTLIALTNNEYRRSDDIDFIAAPQSPTYKKLRSELRDDAASLFEGLPGSMSLGPVRSDQYGIRFGITYVEGDEEKIIKFEIFQEGRLREIEDGVTCNGLPVRCLSPGEQIVQKLLANTDRGLDPHVNHRDLYDLAILVENGGDLHAAIARASEAYDVEDRLRKTLEQTEDPNIRDKDMDELEIDKEFRPLIFDGLMKLRTGAGLSANVMRHHFEEYKEYP
jgi:hypothetical protein